MVKSNFKCIDMAEELLGFLREQRHIFGCCPCCQQIFRLSDSRISYRTTYKPDWMDDLDDKLMKEEEKKAKFEEKRKELRDKAIDEERKKRLPILLNRAVPMFAKRHVNPQDVKTLFDPIDFVVFDGMNMDETVKRVLLLDELAKTAREKSLQESIKNTIETGALTWKTIQIMQDGTIEKPPAECLRQWLPENETK